ncbi:MAG: DUF465 domain-containing protein [Vicinamibacteria bacterium]
MPSAQLDSSLRQQDEEYRRLAEKHQSFEARLKELQTKLFLEEEEKLEEVTIKKQKLQVKDRMELIARRFRQEVS